MDTKLRVQLIGAVQAMGEVSGPKLRTLDPELAGYFDATIIAIEELLYDGARKAIKTDFSAYIPLDLED